MVRIRSEKCAQFHLLDEMFRGVALSNKTHLKEKKKESTAWIKWNIGPLTVNPDKWWLWNSFTSYCDNKFILNLGRKTTATSPFLYSNCPWSKWEFALPHHHKNVQEWQNQVPSEVQCVKQKAWVQRKAGSRRVPTGLILRTRKHTMFFGLK